MVESFSESCRKQFFWVFKAREGLKVDSEADQPENTFRRPLKKASDRSRSKIFDLG